MSEEKNESEQITVVTQLAAIQGALRYLKHKLAPEKWDETPLPVIAAPLAWMQEVSKFMGAPEDEVPELIFNCSVVQKDEVDGPVLIDHDGTTYKVDDIVAATQMSDEQQKERFGMILVSKAVH